MTTATRTPVPADAANREAVERLIRADPVLTDVRPAIEALPEMRRNLVLTSGALMTWEDYSGGQRQGLIGGAMYEGLASNVEDAAAKFAAGEIEIGACHAHGCVGSLAGITTASMPVLVVEDRHNGTSGHCTFYEGASRKRLNYGVYDADVDAGLRRLEQAIAPVIRDALLESGGIPLRPIMRRALHMGDELHSRNTAATLLLTRELVPALVRLAVRDHRVEEAVRYLAGSDYFFLRPGMAAGKAAADAATGIPGSSVVTAMTFNCRDFSIRVSGCGNRWFSARLPPPDAKLFEGHREDDMEYMGGESPINETVGLGGFAQAAAFALQDYQGGTPEWMVETNLEMYRITVAEHTELRIPYLGFRGVPIGIDARLVVDTGVRPVMDIGIAGKGGGQIGAGTLRAPLECFEAAVAALDSNH